MKQKYLAFLSKTGPAFEGRVISMVGRRPLFPASLYRTKSEEPLEFSQRPVVTKQTFYSRHSIRTT